MAVLVGFGLSPRLFAARKPMTNRVRSRFVASLIANIARSGVSFATGLVLARWLEPENYGRMAFLLASFLAFRQLLDMGSSSAFFTLLSQRPRSLRFIAYFWRWVGLQLVISLLIVGFVLPDDWFTAIWKGEQRGLVMLALVATFMQHSVWPVATQMAEAQRQTVRAQRLNTLVVIIHFGVVLLLWRMGQLALPLLFAALALEWGMAGWFAARLYRGQTEPAVSSAERVDTAASVLREYGQYCLPIVPYVWLGFLAEFADRWMLQHWGGAAEQAYYAVASQFATIALLATTSILRIFWKEIAEAHHRQDYARMERLYQKVSRSLFFVAAVVAGGLLPWTGEIIQLTLGPAYAGGSASLMLMLLYPVHQSLGQIGGTVFYATGRTRAYVMMGLVSMAASLIIVYFMLAPRDAFVPGLALAAQGLAWKMLLVQFVTVMVQARLIAGIFRWKFDWIYQLGLALTVAAGWLAKILTAVWPVTPGLVSIVISGLIYMALVGGILFSLPWMVGMDRADLVSGWLSLRRRLLVGH